MSKRPAPVVDETKALTEKAALKYSRKSDRINTGALSKLDKRDIQDVITKEEIDDKLLNNEYESKHTLESDEEEEYDKQEKYRKLDTDNIEGQEEATEDYDGDVKITPFNLKEEEEEGHFDAMGNFVFNKKNEVIKDAWLDGIDWGRIKKDAGKQWNPDKDQNELPEPPLDNKELYKKIIAFLKPKETVIKAMKRLGGSLSAAEARKLRWAQNKAKKEEKTKEVKTNLVEELTGHVDKLLSQGVVDIYNFTFERIQKEIENKGETSSGQSDDKKLDMFAESHNQLELDQSSAEQTGDQHMDIKWEYKEKNEDKVKVHGPFSTEQMIEWQESGKFKDGAWARKVGDTDAPFYSTKRIDFDLYM